MTKKIDKVMMEQFKDCTLEEIIAFSAMEIDELKADFDAMMHFIEKRNRMPLRLMRRTRVKTIGIEKLILLFRKKSIEYKKDVKVQKDEVKKERQALKNLNVQQQALPLQTDLMQHAPTPQNEMVNAGTRY